MSAAHPAPGGSATVIQALIGLYGRRRGKVIDFSFFGARHSRHPLRVAVYNQGVKEHRGPPAYERAPPHHAEKIDFLLR